VIVYVPVKTAGLRSSQRPDVVHGNDEHTANTLRVRVMSLVLIGVTVPERFVNNTGAKSTAVPLGVPLRSVIVVVNEVGM